MNSPIFKLKLISNFCILAKYLNFNLIKIEYLFLMKIYSFNFHIEEVVAEKESDRIK